MPAKNTSAKDLVTHVMRSAEVGGLRFNDLALPVQTVVRAACVNFESKEGFMPIHERFAEALEATRRKLSQPWMDESGAWHRPLLCGTIDEGLRCFEQLLEVAVKELRPHCAAHGGLHGEPSSTEKKPEGRHGGVRRKKSAARNRHRRGRRSTVAA